MVTGVMISVVKITTPPRAGPLFDGLFPKDTSGVDIDRGQGRMTLQKHSPVNHGQTGPPEMTIKEIFGV